MLHNPPDFSVCKKEEESTLFGTARVRLSDIAYQVAAGGAALTFHHAYLNKGQKRSEDTDLLTSEINDKLVLS